MAKTRLYSKLSLRLCCKNNGYDISYDVDAMTLDTLYINCAKNIKIEKKFCQES